MLHCIRVSKLCTTWHGWEEHKPDGVNRDLLPHEGEKGVLHEGAAYGLGGLGQQPVEVLGVVATSHTQELEDGLVVLEAQHSLVACGITVSVVCLGNAVRDTHCRAT